MNYLLFTLNTFIWKKLLFIVMNICKYNNNNNIIIIRKDLLNVVNCFLIYK